MKFQDLEFKPHLSSMGGVQAVKMFENGYRVSVIKTIFSYGGKEGLYELAVLGKDGELHYDNKVADGDVRGHLAEEDVTRLATEVENFKKDEAN